MDVMDVMPLVSSDAIDGVTRRLHFLSKVRCRIEGIAYRVYRTESEHSQKFIHSFSCFSFKTRLA